MSELVSCNFCYRDSGEVKKMIAGDDVYICNECVYQCVGILVEAIKPAEKPEPPKESDV